MFSHIRSEEVNSWLNSRSITWHFITEKSPWRGGFYERIIHVVKRPLKKILQRKIPFFRDLETILTDIEAMVNSRPLTAISATPDDLQALSPANLIFPYPARTRLPETNVIKIFQEDPNAIIISKRYIYSQHILKAYWERFRVEYLEYLKSIHKRKPVESRVIVPGDICLIQDPKPNRATWPLCRVISCHGGTTTDGKKRSCVVRCANGRNYNRPIQALYKLEC